MLHRFFATFLFFGTMGLFAQKNFVSYPPRPFSLDILYGNSILVGHYTNEFNTLKKIDFNLPIRQIGLGLSNLGYCFGPGLSMEATFETNYRQFLKESMYLDKNNIGTVSGFLYSLGVGKPFFKRAKHLRVNICVGFTLGRTRFQTASGDVFTNPVFSPEITIQPKLFVKRVCLSLYTKYLHDTGDKAWKQKNNRLSTLNLSEFDQSQLIVCLALGYCLFNRQ